MLASFCALLCVFFFYFFLTSAAQEVIGSVECYNVTRASSLQNKVSFNVRLMKNKIFSVKCTVPAKG